MALQGEQPATLRLRTEAIPERDRVEVMREVYGRAILKVDLEPLGPPMFDLKMSALPGLGIASGFCSEFRVHHASQMIENDDLILLVALSGSSVMRHRDREELVGPAAR